MENTTLLSPEYSSGVVEKKGVPGFSERLNYIFDLAGAPADSRLSWGAKKWAVVPNTVKNWVKGDIPPQNFATLELVVADLLNLINIKIDKTAVIGWLYAGGKSPFINTSDTSIAMPPINHILQLKIFNKLFELGNEMGVNINNIDEQAINHIINSVYFKITFQRETILNYDVENEIPLLKTLLKTL